MWWSPAALTVSFLLIGMVCDVKEVNSQPGVIHRQSGHADEEVAQLEKEFQRVLHQIHTLSGTTDGTRGFTPSPTGETSFIDTFFLTLSDVIGFFQLGSADQLVKSVVCVLSGQQACGSEAELVKAVSEELVVPLLSFVSSLSTQMCVPLFTEAEGILDSRSGFQETLLSILSSLPPSGNLMSILSNVADSAATNVLKFVESLIRVPVDFITIAFQLGIRVPAVDEEEGTCENGDLKQLIMWGMKHNVTWSFTPGLVEILLDFLLHSETSSCTHPGCNPASKVFPEHTDFGPRGFDPDGLFNCDRRGLARLSDTLCADVLALARPGLSSTVLALCQALNALSPQQMEHTWSNACLAVHSLVLPFLRTTPFCRNGLMQPYPAMPPLPQPVAHPQPKYGRVSREAPNLRELTCSYSSWTDDPADAFTVSSCSENDREAFVSAVCDNAWFMKSLLREPENSWLYEFCANSSTDPAYLVKQFCMYEQWLILKPKGSVDTALLAFCMKLDGLRLNKSICEHTGFMGIVFSNQQNIHFMPNCSALPDTLPGFSVLTLDACRYSEWHDLTKITVEVVLHCIRIDQSAFTREVCANTTYLNTLLRSDEFFWLNKHCTTSLSFSNPSSTQPGNVTYWCDYGTWAERPVDTSVVGFCWQNDRQSFQKNVCCRQTVLDVLLLQPLNQWLVWECTLMEETNLTALVCKYSEWTSPVFVDMTDLAICAEMDRVNFTAKVCNDGLVLHNLLINPDNNWLREHCFNETGVIPGGGGGQGGGGDGPDISEQCRYSTWIASPPNSALLTLCWKHDEDNLVSSICPNPQLLLVLTSQPSTQWASSMCTHYADYTPAITPTPTPSPEPSEPGSCPALNLVKRLQLECSADFTDACRPDAHPDMVLKMVALCWAESMAPKLVHLLTPPVVAVLEQAATTAVVFLLAGQEVQYHSLDMASIIGEMVSKAMSDFLEREEKFEKKKEVLLCFGTLLSSMTLSQGDLTDEDFYLIKEYFKIPLSDLRPVLSSAHVDTVKLMLTYYNKHKDALQLSEEFLSTMLSVFVHVHLPQDGSFFPLVAPLLGSASPNDIQALHSLKDQTVWDTINSNLDHMRPEQKEAFGVWYSKVLPLSQIVSGDQSIITEKGNVIAYVPFYSFQHLSPAQLLNGLDVLKKNQLSSLKQEFVAHSIISTFKTLTLEDFIRLGNLTCLADPEDLLLYKGTDVFGLIQELVMNCTREGLPVTNHLISALLLDSPDLQSPSSLSADRLTEIAHLMPLLGMTFLEGLTPSQLFPVLGTIRNVSFSPAQASLIFDKLISNTELLTPYQLQELHSLALGIKTGDLLKLDSEQLLSVLRAVSKHSLCSDPSKANAIATKLWGFPNVVTWLDDDEVNDLLNCTPLISVLPRVPALVDIYANNDNDHDITTNPYNTQQARALFKGAYETHPDLVRNYFLHLKSFAQGMNCELLKERIQFNPSVYEVVKILAMLRQQSSPLHASLKQCVIYELYQLFKFPELVKDVGAELAVFFPLSFITKFSRVNRNDVRDTILQDRRHFLLLPRTKQDLLVERIVPKEMESGFFTADEFLWLDIMAPFVEDEIFRRIDRRFFLDNLDFLLGLCYHQSKMDIVGEILEKPAVFGPARFWNYSTLLRVDRFLFFLPESSMQHISKDLVSLGFIEKLFLVQRRWESSDFGANCLNKDERTKFFQKQNFFLQFFLGYRQINSLSPWNPVIPTCEILHSLNPAAWPPNALTKMSPTAFSDCLEVMGQDPYLENYQRSLLFLQAKLVLKVPPSSFSQSVLLRLGGLAAEMTVEELSKLQLTERRSIAALGSISSWNNRQLSTLFYRVLNSTKLTPKQLDSSTLVAMGHIVCGASAAVLKTLTAEELGKAAYFLGQLDLPCSTEQLGALLRLLTHSSAFGPMGVWGSEVFIEIGILAAGIDDFSLSSLQPEQIEGLSPNAISKIPVEYFYVAVDERKIGVFSYVQAAAVTVEQKETLSDVQLTALEMILKPEENRPVDFRGRSGVATLTHSPVCLMLGLLMVLIVLTRPDPS